MSKIFLLLATVFVSQSVFAKMDLVTFFSQYESADINNKCSVKFEDQGEIYILEITGSEVRPSLKGYFSDIKEDGAMIELFYYDYDGEGQAYLIQDDAGMNVIMTWEDGENGFDQSTFCRLGLKDNY